MHLKSIMQVHHGVLHVCFHLLALALFVAGGLPCEESGYCSIGAVKPYIGDVSTGKALREALEARSFKKEVIITPSYGYRMEQVQHAYSGLKQVGIAHFMVISHAEDDCKRATTYHKDMGCVWISVFSRLSLPYAPHNSQEHLWMIRTMIIARTIRLGYNVFHADPDVIWFDDLYKYIKSPPFKDINMFCQDENPNGCNYGAVYVQNVTAGSAASWLWVDQVDRWLRMAEPTGRVQMISLGLPAQAHMCVTYDQAFLDESLGSAMVGLPLSWIGQDFCRGKNRDTPWMRKVMSNMKDALNWDLRWRWHKYTTPEAWKEVAEFQDEFKYKTSLLQVPHKDGWPHDVFGGSLFPAERGNASKTFMAMLKEDCPECAEHPDVWPTDTIVAESTPERLPTIKPYMPGGKLVADSDVLYPSCNESCQTFSFFPQWLVGSGFGRTKQGFWMMRPKGGHYQALGHVHYFGRTDGEVMKLAIRKMYHGFDWNLSQWRLHKDNNMYHAEHSQGERGPPYFASPKVERVLAMAPDIMLSLLRSYKDYQSMAAGLAQLAYLTGRIPAWPALPCNTSWANTDVNRQRPPYSFEHNMLPYNDYFANNTLTCSTVRWLQNPCVLHGAGLLQIEFSHWLHHLYKGGPLNVMSLEEQLKIVVDGAPLVQMVTLGDSRTMNLNNKAVQEILDKDPIERMTPRLITNLKDAVDKLKEFSKVPLLYLYSPVDIVPSNATLKPSVDLQAGTHARRPDFNQVKSRCIVFTMQLASEKPPERRKMQEGSDSHSRKFWWSS